ncbi:hypothetical protein EPO44_03850 [bacterium]|nr:MAG: hypothetical protein EPO44_03850 [bacterium]
MNEVERCLEQNPKHPRAVLLCGRLLYQEGRMLETLESLHLLGSILGQDEGLKTITASLERLWQEKNVQTEPAFITEAMAGLLTQQGYLLEAMKIYRQLFLASGREGRLWERILFLREQLAREGSREARKEKIAEDLEEWDRWIQEQRRGN